MSLRDSSSRDSEETVEIIKLDALAVLKVIKHCRENLPSLVSGQLLGLDFDTSLEITNCFPFPGNTEEENEDEDETAEYQFNMLRSMREVNCDSTTVGWYQSAFLDSFLSADMIESHFQYQDAVKKSVVIVYDPLKTNAGTLALRAFRLRDAFMAVYKSQDFTQDRLTELGLDSSDIWQEIPIQINIPALVQSFLADYGEKDSTICDFQRLDLATNPFLEKNLAFLSECLDDLAEEQKKFQFYQRQVQRQLQQQKTFIEKRRAENQARRNRGEEPLPEEEGPLFKPIPAPSRLESLLVSNQIQTYCKQINMFAGESFSKLFLVGDLHKEQ
eukprot:GILI01004536.1.p1 GENE.GILI01004536.1~~GILI01004536.1.p1  ORF type:complete len:330 (+),score=117.75 GILI01004536.1:107-1096(+)